MFKIRDDLFAGNKWLVSSVVFALGFLMFLGFYVYARANEPAVSDGVLLRTEGRFVAIASSTQRSTTFVVEVGDSGKLLKFSAVEGYTRVRSGFSKGIGQNIVLRHYGRSVVACWIDGVEYCTAICRRQYECELNLYRASISTFENSLYTAFGLAVICLVVYFLKRQGADSGAS